MTAQAAFLLVTDTGKKKILPAVLPQLLQGLLPLELRVVSGRYNRIECICLLPRNSSHGVLSKTVLTADNQCSLPTVNSGENLEVGGTFGNLMYFNPILVLQSSRQTVSPWLFRFALLVELEWHCCTHG